MDEQKKVPAKVRPAKPHKAAKSTEARTTAAPILNKGYSEAGASYTRKALAGMKPNSGSAAEDINENLLTLRQRSRMLYMGAPVATSAIRTNRTNVVGNGLQLKSTIDYMTLGMTQEQAEEWQRHTENEFKLWASNKRNCDATGINDFYGMQQLALVSWLISGDVLALTKFVKREPLRPYGLRLHLIEADRCRCPVTPGTFQSTASVKLEGGGYIHDGEYARAHAHRGICSESEYAQIARDLELAAKVGCAYHVCHISAKESVELIRQAKRTGVDATCETAPHYLVLDDSNLKEEGRFKMNPPLRSAADREALIEGIKDGTVDMIATDHAPHSAEEKAKGLEIVGGGIPGTILVAGRPAFPLAVGRVGKASVPVAAAATFGSTSASAAGRTVPGR